jgi:hypothetical protein
MEGIKNNLKVFRRVIEMIDPGVKIEKEDL